MTRLRFRPEVASDLENAFDWYESRREGLGSSFAQEVEDALSRIETNPRLYVLVDREEGVRRARLRRFPYSILYLPTSEHIAILAVTHQARKPDSWRRRLLKELGLG